MPLAFTLFYLPDFFLTSLLDLFEKRNLKKTLEEPGRKEVIIVDDGIRVIKREN